MSRNPIARPGTAGAILLCLAVVASACSVDRPAREDLSIPVTVVPDFINPTDWDALFSASGECRVAIGGGVKVLEPLQDTAAFQVLQAGDIITSINSTPITSLETMAALTSRLPVGARVEVGGTRGGQPFMVGIELGPAPEDPTRPIVGFIPETYLEAVPPSELQGLPPAEQWTANFVRPINLGGRITFFDPLGGAWYQYPGVATNRMAALDSEIYTLASNDHPRSLLRIGDGQVINFDPQSDPDGSEVIPDLNFTGVVGTVGGLLLVSAWAYESGPGSLQLTLVAAADPTTAEVVWARFLGVSEQGFPWLAVNGYRSPAGNRVLLEAAEVDPTSNTQTESFRYGLLDTAGNFQTRPGLETLALSGVVTGWFDDTSLLYVVPGSEPQVFKWTLDSNARELVISLSAEDRAGLLFISPVGDGRHLLQINENEVTLIDGEELVEVRPVARGCSYFPFGGLAG